MIEVTHGDYSVKMLADSISPYGVRLVTMETVYPRFIHSEMLRHRVQSHSVASSRAMPPNDVTSPDGTVKEGTISRVRNRPFVPATFNKRVKGMGVGEAFFGEGVAHSKHEWLLAASQMADRAEMLNDIGIDKSRINRLLEPFLFVTDIISATEWDNFFALRCPAGDEPDIDFPAQLEFQQIAILMREAMRQSTPQALSAGKLHLPKITEREMQHLITIRGDFDSVIGPVERDYSLVSSRRVARVSFDRHTDSEDFLDSRDKATALASDAHFSPFEHVATPISHLDIDDPERRAKLMVPAEVVYQIANGVDPRKAGVAMSDIWCGNFRGWFQFRKTFANEGNHAAALAQETCA